MHAAPRTDDRKPSEGRSGTPGPRADERILLIGAGALARDIIAGCEEGTFCGVLVEPGFDVEAPAGLAVFREWAAARSHATHYVLGLLDTSQRRRLHEAATAAGLLPAAPLLSPRASVSPHASLGGGCVIGHNVQIGAGARLGRDVMVMHNAVVAHDVQVGDNTVILPGAWIGGYVRIGQDSFVGANSVTTPHVQVGCRCVIAPGGACMRSIPDGSLLIGNPGRVARRRG